MRKCGSCFRFTENNDDVKKKGLQPISDFGNFYEIERKPRPGIKCRCSCHAYTEEFQADQPGCEYHQYRWTWNLKQWYTWKFRYGASRWLSTHVRIPIGRHRKPVKLEWIDYFDGSYDRIIRYGEPRCPHCGEMPYSTEQCVFCGQRFIQEEES